MRKWRIHFKVIVAESNQVIMECLRGHTFQFIYKDEMTILKLSAFLPKTLEQSLSRPSSSNTATLQQSTSSAFTRLARKQSKQNILESLRRGSRVNVLGEMGETAQVDGNAAPSRPTILA